MTRKLAAAAILVGLCLPSAALGDPTNATCETARVLAFPSKTTDSTIDVAVDSLVPACGKNDPFAAWYRFTAPETGRYEAITTQDSDALTDTTLAFFSSCGGDVLACNDDTLTSLFADDYVDLVADQEVFVRVAGWARLRGSFRLELAHPADVGSPGTELEFAL